MPASIYLWIFLLSWCFTSTETVGFIRDGASVFRPLKALESSLIFSFPMPLQAYFFVRGLFSDCLASCVCVCVWARGGGGGVAAWVSLITSLCRKRNKYIVVLLCLEQNPSTFKKKKKKKC